MSTEGGSNWKKWVYLHIAGIVFILLVCLLMLWLTGFFHAKIDGRTGTAPATTGPAGQIVRVQLRRVPVEETAVGTVQPVHRVELASRLMARIVELNATAGQSVKKGDVLVRLENADLQAKLKQAEAQVAQAMAERDRAKLDADRLTSAAGNSAASASERDRAIAVYKSAEAAVAVGEQSISEARTLLEFATILSPIDGIVVDKKMNVGDTSTPGLVIIALLDPTKMQLVASVRESLSQRLKVGGEVTVRIESMDHGCRGTVSEIVPEAQGSSRSFQVKVSGPCPPGVYTGMFGRLVIPLGEESVLVVPRKAILRTGQLDFVIAGEGASAGRRLVRIGRDFGEDVEILSGLVEGEAVQLPSTGATHE